jgi:predicted HTH transcriptional regulator
MSDFIKELIERGENEKVDFKFEISDSKKIAKTISAFSNTSGGRLLVGIKDNGKVAGVRSDEEFYMVQAAADLYSKPKVTFKSKQYNIDSKPVLEVQIPRAIRKPVMAFDISGKWLAYIRIHDENRLVNKIQLNIWQRETNNDGILIKYTEKEKLLFDYLSENQFISLSRYCKITNLPRFEAERKITDLILIQVLSIHYIENQILYSFNADFDQDKYNIGELFNQK